MSLPSAALIGLAVILLLFAVAAVVEGRGGLAVRRPWLRQGAYTLALGVYCSSWTFYGAVGSIVRDGWFYLPIYLAPIFLLLGAPRFLKRLAQAVAEEQATTVSDFIAARFGHDGGVARLVTLIALVGTIPYVALQFRSIGGAISLASGRPIADAAMIGAAGLLALFAILFGARRYELAGRSEGLLYAIGLESVIKIVALTTVAAVAVALLMRADAAAVDQGMLLLADNFRPERLSVEFGVIFLISLMAIIALPRQFYMGLVEAHDSGSLGRARYGLAAYLAVMAIMALPIALAGASLVQGGAGADLYVLQIPALAGSGLVLTLALVGGISAAASMVIVDSTALATMVSNDLIFPALLRSNRSDAGEGAFGRRMLRLRRASILGIVAAALAWALLIPADNTLASIGLVAFAAMAQFTPHLILATQRGGRDAMAARASLSIGFALWVYTLALPPILPDGLADMLAGSALDPLRLFGIGNASPLVHGVAWSLGANLLVYGLVAARKVQPRPLLLQLRGQQKISDLDDLSRLTASFVGTERAREEFPDAAPGVPVTREAAQRARDLIARVVGASSARALVASALAGSQMSLADVTRLLGERGQSLRFSRELLAATFENVDAGISVVDSEMNLVAWNSQYLDIFGYPPALVQVGAPIAELIRYNARLGDFGSEDIEHHVDKRLGHMRRGQPHSFERQRKDGRVIKTVGGPMPGGGYVTSFTDITSEAQVRDELERTLAQLEQRVVDRTQELSAANAQLAKATRDKTRFLAAASHDLLQPLHAARLFTAALTRDAEAGTQMLARRIDSAIGAADGLIRALLDISRLDAGGVEPSPEPVALKPFIIDLAESFAPMADGKGLRLRIGALPGDVHTDPGLLRSVLQNFLSNAVRYTSQGVVLIGTRRRGQRIRIDIIDTGVGIAADQIDMIFAEFTRLGQVEAEGLGLGLALCDRIARLLGGEIEVRSVPGRGSRFSLYLPASTPQPATAIHPQAAIAAGPRRALNVLVVDNDPMIVEGTLELLASLGHGASGAGDPMSALALAGPFDVALIDFHLGTATDGLALIAALRERHPGLPAALVTAQGSSDLAKRAALLGVPIIAKPAGAETIGGFLASVGEVPATAN
ncbi:PAS domain-containing hybrid sensor histidine kinase/response regulator [Blastomonas sp. AAP53]|uniref:hybrid sensor histidine kinase/response regulator n=1 Tax=Blastomonas sp. AAP53 TaxID=1248760 RepID=UPI0002D676B8|nr:PAS domain-containing hybrid sensor histidine kinase/response regulator [Blastomonas sp. AAP53]